MRRLGLLAILCAMMCVTADSQGPPGPGERDELEGNGPRVNGGADPPAPAGDGAEDAGPDAVPMGGPAEERPNLNGVDLEGIDLPEELEGVAPDIAAELLKIWPKQPPPADGVFSMAFRQTEIRDFLQFMADNTGYIYIVPPELEGKVTITAQIDVPVDMAFQILEAWLSVKGFAMVRDDEEKLVRVEEAKRTKTRGSDVGAGLDADEIVGGQEYTTQVVQLENISADAAVDLIKPLVDSDTGIISASADLNAVIITDAADNVRRLVSIIAFLEKEVDQTEQHEVVVRKLKNADAQSVATMLEQLFQQSQGLSPEIQRALQRGGGEGGAPPAGAGAGLIGLRGRVKITADERTNSVIVLASREKLDMVKEIIDEMDDVTAPEIAYKVIPIEHADPIDVANTLNDLWEQPRGVVSGRSPFSSFMSQRQFRYGEAFYGLKENVAVADIRSSKIIITASVDNIPAFEKMVEALDKPKSLQELTRVFRLNNARAEDVTDALNEALQGRRRSGGFLSMMFGGSTNSGSELDRLREVTATPEPITNQIIVTAQPQSFELVERMIADLDRRQPQVFIRVIIADVTLTEAEAFGVEWNWFAPNVGGNIGTTGDVDWNATDPVADRQGMRWGMISQAMQGFLSSVKERGNVRIISTPHIMMVDNQWGGIEIGERIPVLTSISESTSGRITQEIDYEEAQILLWVRPQVGESGHITMRLFQRIDDVEPGRGRPDTPQGQPTFINRQAFSTVSVQDGQTIILGGILQSAKRKTKDGVPILRDIPIIGSLFEHEREETVRTELMVFLTPYVVLDEEDAARHTRDEINQMTAPVSGLDPTAKTDTRWDNVEDTGEDAVEGPAEGEGATAPLRGPIRLAHPLAEPSRGPIGPMWGGSRTGWRLD